MEWNRARHAAHAAGTAARPEPCAVPLANADATTLAAPLTALTDLPAFATSTVDGYAIRGRGPWPVVGRILAGRVAEPIDEGTAVQIATGAMVPKGTERIVRSEDAELDPDGRLRPTARSTTEWREPGDEAALGEELVPAGTPVTPGLVGLAAACGHDTLTVTPASRVGLVMMGDELLTSGPPGAGRIRDSLGPQLPAWLRRLGAEPVAGLDPLGPIPDSLDAQAGAIAAALERADVVCTAGGTRRGPVDHLHASLVRLGARYIVDSVAVRPGLPMLLAEVPSARGRPRFVVGMPGNPQSAIVTLVTLVTPLLRGLAGRTGLELPSVRLAAPAPDRGSLAHLVLVRLEDDGAVPVDHAGSAMLRGLARSDGFAVIAPGRHARTGDTVPFVALPLGPRTASMIAAVT
jgi:molybdopterin molybdotransferase